MVKREVKAFQRFFVSGATECPIDKLGRILVPPTLREYAQLEKDVVFAGMGKMFEIWSRARWTEEIERAEDNFEGMRESLSNLGI